MRRIIELCAALAIAAAPALADAPFAPPTPPIDPAFAKSSPKSVARTFTLNGIKGALEKTTFAELQKHFGGQIEHQGDAAASLSWLCYDLPAKHLRVWLASDEVHDGAGLINEVTIWTVSRPADSPRCPVASGRQSADIDGVAPGQDAAGFEMRLGMGVAKDGWSAYTHNEPLDGGSEDDYIAVKTENGRVSHLQASRSTTS